MSMNTNLCYFNTLRPNFPGQSTENSHQTISPTSTLSLVDCLNEHNTGCCIWDKQILTAGLSLVQSPKTKHDLKTFKSCFFLECIRLWKQWWVSTEYVRMLAYGRVTLCAQTFSRTHAPADSLCTCVTETEECKGSCDCWGEWGREWGPVKYKR